MSSTPSSLSSPNGSVHSLSIESSHTSSSPSPSSPSLHPFPHPNHSKLHSSRCLLLSLALTLVAAALLVGLLAGLLTRSSSSSSPSSPSPSPTYRAVAVQYLPYTNSSPSTTLSLNLATYQAIVASLIPLAPHLIAFPEGGLGYLEADEASPLNATATRAALLPFCEPLPPPSPSSSSLCAALNATVNPQLSVLSCLALSAHTTLVVNLCQVQYCTPGSPPPSPSSSPPFPFASTSCPPDGFYLWSSNVVLSPSGALLAVYPKAHLFDTLSFNTPTPTPTTFTLSLPLATPPVNVTMATVVAFDIEFTQPLRALLLQGVQHFVWTGWWATNQPPQLTAAMVQAGWAARWGVNLVAANALNNVGEGGGVYSGAALATVAFDPAFVAQPGDWKVAVQDLPAVLPQSPAPLTSPNPTSAVVGVPVGGGVSVPCTITAIGEVGNCTFLSPSSSTSPSTQTVAAAHGDVRCVATVSSPSADPSSYALFASQTAYTALDTPSSLYLESCALLYCPGGGVGVGGGVQCAGVGWGAPVGYGGVEVWGGFNCSRFAPTVGDGGGGEGGGGPAGTVLPMMAVGQAEVVAGGGYAWTYAGKAGGSCWWNMSTTRSTSKGLYSIGFYATDGQENPSSS